MSASKAVQKETEEKERRTEKQVMSNGQSTGVADRRGKIGNILGRKIA
jgi:hypothetical protein